MQFLRIIVILINWIFFSSVLEGVRVYIGNYQTS